MLPTGLNVLNLAYDQDSSVSNKYMVESLQKAVEQIKVMMGSDNSSNIRGFRDNASQKVIIFHPNDRLSKHQPLLSDLVLFLSSNDKSP